MVSKILLKLTNIEMKATILEQMKSQFTQKQISENFESNFNLIKKDIQSSGIKIDAKFEEMARKMINSNFCLVEKTKDMREDLLNYYDSNKVENSDVEMSECSKETGLTSIRKTKKIFKKKNLTHEKKVYQFKDDDIFFE